MSTGPGQNLADQLLRNRLRIQQRVQPGVFRRQDANKSGPRESLGHEHGADSGSLVSRHELGSETLVERDGRRLGGRVVRHVGRGHVSGQRGDSHHHTVVAFDHARQELTCQPVVREGIDLEHLSSLSFRRSQDGRAATDTDVVDQHRWLAQCRPDAAGDFGDGGR